MAFSPLVAIPAATMPIFQILFLVVYLKLAKPVRRYFRKPQPALAAVSPSLSERGEEQETIMGTKTAGPAAWIDAGASRNEGAHPMDLLLAAILFVLSFLAGMMGLGVAFIATPVLGLFGLDLKDTIMPLSLWLNGLTAISGAVAYTRAKMVDWRTAIPLLVITAITAPLGVWVLQLVPVTIIWWLYAALLVFLAWRMAFPGKKPPDDEKPATITDRTRVKGGMLSAGIGVIAGFLGVGPGFLLVPTLVMLGMTTRIAAATNSVVVTVPSFTAFFMHLSTINRIDWLLYGATSITALAGAWLGARFMAKRVKSKTLSYLFAAALLLLAIQRIGILVLGS